MNIVQEERKMEGQTKKSQVLDEIERLKLTIDCLSKAIDTLYERTESIRLAQPIACGKEEQKRASLCKMAMAIVENNDRLQTQISRLQGIISELEI